MDTATSMGRTGGGEPQWVALLGRRDEPADGVEDYCDFLRQSLGRQGIEVQKVRVDWFRRGWRAALRELWRESAGWRGRWVLLQYTALGWSRRGFPLGALAVGWILQRRGARCAVVFHEASGQAGPGLAGKLRETFQAFVVRRLYRCSAKSIFTIPLNSIGWLDGACEAAFIPIGANIPAPTAGHNRRVSNSKTVVVFCLTPGPNREIEIRDAANAVRVARREGVAVRLVVLGRSTADVKEQFERELAGSGAEVSVLGMLPAGEVAQILSSADAQLFVCGCASQRRGSALAGVACGLPIVGYAGQAAGTEIEQAGLELAPYRDAEALGRALVKVLTDDELNARLRERSRAAHARHFSWETIAEKYRQTLCANDAAKPLRVLIYSEYFLPVVGGVQTAVNLLARELSTPGPVDATRGKTNASRNVQVTLVTRTRERTGDDSEFAFRVVRHPGWWTLVKMVREADVIHVAGPCLAPMVIAWLLERPFVVEHHGYQAICPDGMLFKQPSHTVCVGHFMAGQYGECVRCRAANIGWISGLRSVLLNFPRLWLSRRATANIGISEHVCKRHGLPRSRPIYYGIDRVPMTNGNSNSAARASARLEVAYVGRLVEEKGLPLLLEAAKRLKEEGVQFHLTFIGDGPERGSLENCVDEWELRNAVTFTGNLLGPELERAVENVDVVAMPTVCEETAGLSAIEQMMRGRLVVVSEIGGLGEVVGDAGLKFPPGDSNALASQLRKAALDHEEMRRLGQAARARAEKVFTVDRMAAEHERLYREVAAVTLDSGS